MSGPKKLQEALRKAVAETWTALLDEHGDDGLYAFGLYVTRDVLFIGPTAASEAGLRSLAEDGSEAERWVLKRSPLHLWGEERFERVQTLLAERPDPYELEGEAFDEEIRTRLEACFGALKALDEKGVFGEGEGRHRLVLNVFSADESDRQRLENAGRLNPPEALEALEPALEIREPTGDPELLGSERVLQVGAIATRDGHLVAAGTSGELIGWSIEGETIEERFCVREEDEHWAVAVGVTGAVLYGSTTGIRRRALDQLELPELLHEGAKVTQLVIAPDGSLLVADESFERLVAIGEDRQVMWRREPGGRPLAMSRDGREIAAAGKNHESIRLLDPTTGDEKALVPAAHVSAAAFGPKAEWIATANRQAVMLHDRTDGWAVATEWAVDGPANALAFSPDGAHLAAVFDDGTLKVFNVETKAKVLDVHGRQQSLLAVAWIDDTRVAAGGRDPERGPPVYVWRLPSS